jgi:glucosylceramidase
MVGFGAALTDSSAWLMQNRMNATQRGALLDELFSSSGGIGINYLRLPMGASDFTASGFYTYNDLPAGQTDLTQSQFSVAHDEAYIIPLLQQAQAINPDLRLMGTPWSAPAWMKTNGSLFGGALDSQWHGSYAIYLKKFVDAYAAAGLPVDTLSLQNEPLFTPGNYPSMGMSSAQQAELIKNHVGPVFAAAGIDTRILLYDHNWDNTDFANDILNDSTARQFVAGTAFHGYAGDVSAQSDLHNSHPDKDIYFTEISGGDFAPNFEDNLVWGVKNIIIGNTRNWGRSALYWNLALDENHGPHVNGCSDCRGVVTIDSNSGDVSLNEEYYTIAHASKFVQPGAVRIHSSTVNNTVETVAFLNPDGSKALIALNPSGSSKTFRIVENEQFFSYVLSRKSVSTFVWGVNPADFNDDGQLDIEDIDRLMIEVSGGSNGALFDLTQDGLVDLDDVSQWLADAGASNLPSGNAFLFADSNLDGVVDGLDFIAWNASKFTIGRRWSQGEFNGDGVIDGQDFIVWNGNKFTSSDEVSILPEPGTRMLLLIAMVLLQRVAVSVSRRSPHLLPLCRRRGQDSRYASDQRPWAE